MVTRFRKEIDPYFIPMCVKTVYRSPANTEMVFVRHVIAFAGGDTPLARKHWDFRNCQIQNPVMVDKHRIGDPHDIMEILEGPHLGYLPQELPGPFYPLSEMHLHKYKALSYWGRHISKEEEGEEYVAWAKANVKAIDTFYKQESDYRWEHDWRYMMKQTQGLDAREVAMILDGRLVMH